MLTFLFDQYRQDALNKYKLRLAIIHMAMLTVLFIVGTALSIPTFVLLGSRLNAAHLEKKAAENLTGETTDTIVGEVLAIKAQLALIDTDNTEIPITTVIDRIMTYKGPDIRIDAISLKRKTESGAISISGVAPSRDALVAFSKRLQSEPSFANVNLPVGSLTRNKDVPFLLNIDSKI